MKLCRVFVCGILAGCFLVNCSGSSRIRSSGSNSLQVQEFAFCRSVENRQPSGTGRNFPSNVGRVYFWTKIYGADRPTEIKHVWYYENERWLEIPLTIKSIRYRTWSYFTIRPELIGKWHVQVENEHGNVLGKYSFKIK